jgi:hypothetical protein
MNSTRLLGVVLCLIIVLSGVNYLFYYERIRVLDAQSREAVNSIVTNPLGTIVKSADLVDQKSREYHSMVNREIALVVLAIGGFILSARRRQPP